MEPFITVESVAIPMRADNIDTDQIIPARFLRRPRKSGYQDYLFHDERFDSDGNILPDCVLNNPRYKGARIIVAGKNFACGSSREGAVYALVDYGIRVVIAPSFSDIFFNNALLNGLLPVRLGTEEIETIFRWLRDRPGNEKIRVDLEEQSVQAGDSTFHFEINGIKRRCLLEGLDEITLTRSYAGEIERYEDQRRAELPWLTIGN